MSSSRRELPLTWINLRPSWYSGGASPEDRRLKTTHLNHLWTKRRLISSTAV